MEDAATIEVECDKENVPSVSPLQKPAKAVKGNCLVLNPSPDDHEKTSNGSALAESQDKLQTPNTPDEHEAGKKKRRRKKKKKRRKSAKSGEEQPAVESAAAPTEDSTGARSNRVETADSASDVAQTQGVDAQKSNGAVAVDDGAGEEEEEDVEETTEMSETEEEPVTEASSAEKGIVEEAQAALEMAAEEVVTCKVPVNDEEAEEEEEGEAHSSDSEPEANVTVVETSGASEERRKGESCNAAADNGGTVRAAGAAAEACDSPASPEATGQGDGADVCEAERSGDGSGSEHERAVRRYAYDEEYVTVDEDAPAPLPPAELEEGEVDDDTPPQIETGEFEEPSADMIAKIVKQMEFYFSDANILKDYFLLRRIRKSKGGWIRLSVPAGFKLMQSITTDWRQVAYAIRHHSPLLELDDEGIRVRRRGGLPEWDHHVYRRTCLVYGFERLRPRKGDKVPDPSRIPIDYVKDEIFKQFSDHITLVRVLKPGKEVPLDLKTCVRNHEALGKYLCAVVEFDTADTAETARAALDGWWPRNRGAWSPAHRLEVKILGKRSRVPLPSCPDEHRAVYGPDPRIRFRAYGPRWPDGYSARLPAWYPRHPLPQQPPPRRTEEHERREESYADKVRGRKRPRPELYSDKVRGDSGSKPTEEKNAPADDEASPAEGAASQPVREKRKLVPMSPSERQRRQPRRSLTTSYEAAAASKEAPVVEETAAVVTDHPEEKKTAADEEDSRRDEGTQTTPEQSGTRVTPTADRRKSAEPRPGLVLIRAPRGPPEEGSGLTWQRQARPAASPPAPKASEALPESVPEEREATTPAAAAEVGRAASLVRRRSVRELVKKFEALASPEAAPRTSPVVRRRSSLRFSPFPVAEEAKAEEEKAEKVVQGEKEVGVEQ